MKPTVFECVHHSTRRLAAKIRLANGNCAIAQGGLFVSRCAEALHAVDAEAWATLNSDVSRPFDKPKTGLIAVKVINHLGDEVMKVFGVA